MYNFYIREGKSGGGGNTGVAVSRNHCQLCSQQQSHRPYQGKLLVYFSSVNS